MNKTNSITPSDFDQTTIGALADAFGKDFLTIKRWIAANDDRLTSEKAREVYRSLADRNRIAPEKS